MAGITELYVQKEGCVFLLEGSSTSLKLRLCLLFKTGVRLSGNSSIVILELILLELSLSKPGAQRMSINV